MEFRRISSITEYRELYTNSLHQRFGIEAEAEYTEWKSLNGSKMLTLTATELRELADVIEK